MISDIVYNLPKDNYNFLIIYPFIKEKISQTFD